MDLKKLVRTKTFWASIASIITAIFMIKDGAAEAGTIALVLGLQGIFMRDGISKIEKNINGSN